VISQLYFGTYLLHVPFLCYTMNSYSTVTPQHISQFFYIGISTDVGCLPFHPSFILLGWVRKFWCTVYE